MKTKEDRIKTVMGGGGHVVILGAGASIASTLRNPEKNAKKLPSMDNFIDVLELTDLVSELPEKLQAKNFENLYSNLYNDNPKSNEIKEIEQLVYDYFENMQLSNEATIYDYLLLALRPRDLIATFNWDPFLFQAYCRNSEFADMPRLAFLHGNVAIGFNEDDMRAAPANSINKKTYHHYAPTKLLYPVTQKNYNETKFLQIEWTRIKSWLKNDSTKMVTVFGYGAPATDVEAMNLLLGSYGGGKKRVMEQFEIIDIRPEEVVTQQWDKFIHSHHYHYSSSYFESSLAFNPRRTSESYFEHYTPLTIGEALSESNPVPSDIKTLKDLWEWHRPLIEAEEEWKKKHPDAEL